LLFTRINLVGYCSGNRQQTAVTLEKHKNYCREAIHLFAFLNLFSQTLADFNDANELPCFGSVLVHASKVLSK
jgi:hypothetical protein